MPRRLVPALLALAAIPAAFGIAACGASDEEKVSGITPVDANCGDVQYFGSGRAEKLIVSDLPLQGDSAERSKQMNDAILQEMARMGSARRYHRGWLSGLRRFARVDRRVGREPLPLQCAGLREQPRRDRRDRHLQLGLRRGRDPRPQQARGLAMVSPGNTFVCLTEPGDICKPNEPDVYYPSGKRNYIRVVPNDAVQMAGLATFANGHGIRNPYILVAADDPTSKGQADTFEGAARSLGMNIAGVEQWDPKAKSYTDLMQKVKASGADAVLLAGLLEQNGAQIIKDKVSVLGPNDGPVKLLAPDGFAQQSTIDQAGATTKGMYASLPGKVPSSLTGEGSAFVKELKSQIGDQPLELFAPYAGQAAEVLMPAIQSGSATRSGVIASLLRTRVHDGIVGSFSITQSGDPSPAPISVSQAEDTFVLSKTITPLPQLVNAARGR